MLQINIITLGKLKESYWKDAQKEYLKRLQIFAKINIIELKEEAFTDKDNFEIVKNKEADKILKAIPKDSFVIILDKEGRQYSSDELSKKIIQLTNNQINPISIIIGGPLGLHESIKNIAKENWSFSKLTFTHQMIRVVLLEQIYRGFMIANKRKYHY